MTDAQIAPERPPSTDVKVLLADDHTLVRESFRALLDVSPGFEAGTGTEAVQLARQHRPDAVSHFHRG